MPDTKELTLDTIIPGRMYTAGEAAPLFRISERTIRSHCAQGVFPNAVKIASGRRWLIPGGDLLAALRREGG